MQYTPGIKNDWLVIPLQPMHHNSIQKENKVFVIKLDHNNVLTNIEYEDKKQNGMEHKYK